MTYIPTGCKTLKESVEPQIRLGIQGYPGSGKTWAALTFPNPIVLNLDRGLGAHFGREDVIEVPLYDAKFVRETMKMPGYHPSGLKDIITKWLETEASKLSETQTLVVDGCSDLESSYHRWFKANAMSFVTKNGTVDGFAEWNEKKNFFGEVMSSLKALRCNVVFLCHEVDLKDKNGPQGPSYSGKVRPLLTGAYGDKLAGDFSDWFRQHSASKPTDWATVNADNIKRDWNMTKDEYKKFCDSIPGPTIYYWQTRGDNIFDAKASSLAGAPLYIPATYKSLIQYRRSK